ncbi:MAG: RNA methyltransferase [Pseudomonadota bacterium]|nr:RNA methyltransferase [Pseudomonadota bacterium]
MTTDPNTPDHSGSSTPADHLRIVLVCTQHPGNIGSAARAIKTMGLSRLVLVGPERPTSAEAAALAAGADDVLAGALRFETLAEAVADCRLVLGCTARSRRVPLDELHPRDAAARAVGDAATGAEVALVFGRERTGLTNDELQLCHAAVNIPANPEYSSLNLAAAVQVLAYELRLSILERNAAAAGMGAAGNGAAVDHRRDDPPASHAELEGFFTQLAGTLDAIDFHKGRAPESAMRKLRRLFLRADLDAREVRLLRGILADAERMAMLAGQRR